MVSTAIKCLIEIPMDITPYYTCSLNQIWTICLALMGCSYIHIQECFLEHTLQLLPKRNRELNYIRNAWSKWQLDVKQRSGRLRMGRGTELGFLSLQQSKCVCLPILIPCVSYLFSFRQMVVISQICK